MNAGVRAMQVQLPSLHALNEDFLSIYNAANARKVVFNKLLEYMNGQSGLSGVCWSLRSHYLTIAIF